MPRSTDGVTVAAGIRFPGWPGMDMKSVGNDHNLEIGTVGPVREQGLGESRRAGDKDQAATERARA